jgi:hypothetical protein
VHIQYCDSFTAICRHQNQGRLSSTTNSVIYISGVRFSKELTTKI